MDLHEILCTVVPFILIDHVTTGMQQSFTARQNEHVVRFSRIFPKKVPAYKI